MADAHYALWGFCLVVTLLGLWGLMLFFGGFRRLFHGRMAAGGSRIMFGLLFLFVFAFVAAVAWDLRTYLRLTYEEPVATLSFAAVGPQDFRATLTDATGKVSHVELRGDDWQLDARVLKWKGMATVLGMDPLYRLDRVEGRYRNTAQESHDYHSVLDLSVDQGVDLWSLAQRNAGWLPWVDAVYGSATYMPMADGAQFSVSISPTGLLARPLNKAAQDAMSHW
ncbi:MAG TPA: cation/multidrug efflux pump [Gammaproteobacteria bacterium]|nr:cation/multidrug efflux pump [Gammaproteobacteria bacterium]